MIRVANVSFKNRDGLRIKIKEKESVVATRRVCYLYVMLFSIIHRKTEKEKESTEAVEAVPVLGGLYVQGSIYFTQTRKKVGPRKICYDRLGSTSYRL